MIVTESGTVNFFFAGIKPTAKLIAAAYEHLSALPASFFPVTYRVDVALPDGPHEGTLEGFYWFEYEGDVRVLRSVR